VSIATDEVTKEAAKAATATLSQLLARILNQLSLSAWLPSAALVLIIAFILELAGHQGTAADAGAAISLTLGALSKTSFAGVVLLSLVIVVCTMVTQAFSFEAIRVLEGYWGAGDRAEKMAARRCKTFERHKSELDTKYESLIEAAWRDVELSIAKQKPRFTRAMTEKLRERVTGAFANGNLSEASLERVMAYDWEAHVEQGVLRRLRNVEKRLADYPRDESRIMPTRLGNVLRRYEAETGADDVEGFIERVYRHLPFSLQLSHDEQRARLDLYCSMVFVLWFCALVATARFGWWDWPYTVGFVGAAVVASIVAYRAAVASARYYGTLLVSVATFLDEERTETD
jgi:hypothetical protein